MDKLIEEICEILQKPLTKIEYEERQNKTPGILLYYRNKDLYFDLLKRFIKDNKFQNAINCLRNNRIEVFVEYLQNH